MFDPAQFRANWNVSGTSDLEAVKQSLVLVFWAYLGLESASVAAAVVENPERNVAIATIAGVLLAALIYMVVSAAMMGLAPASDLANSSAPFALVAGKIFGPVAGPLVAGAGMLKALGTLAGWVLLTAQMQPRRRGSRPAAADLCAHARRRHAGRGARDRGPRRNGRCAGHHLTDARQTVRAAQRSRDVVLPAHVPGRLRGGDQVSTARCVRAERHWRRVLRLCHRLVECRPRSRPRLCAWSCSRCSICRRCVASTCCPTPRCAPERGNCASGTTIPAD